MPTSRWSTGMVALAVVAGSTGCGGGAGEAVVGCEGAAPVADRPLRVTATVAPITDLVATVAAGTDTTVDGLVPEGTDSHTYEPSPGVAAIIARSDVLFLNGLRLEEPTRALALANLGAGAVLCELGTTVLPPSEFLFDVSFPEEAGAPNPHLWTNPPMAGEYVDLITAVLVASDPADAAVYETNAAVLRAAIDELDAAVRTATASVPPERRLLLTYHDAYAYFAREYGWTVLGAIQPSSFSEPSPEEVADLIDQVRAAGVPAIFGSEVFPSPVLEQIAAATGAVYVDDLRDDDLPGAPGEAEHSWFELMRFNVTVLVEALGGDASAVRALQPPGLDAGAP